jgi:hypothetical protein
MTQTGARLRARVTLKRFRVKWIPVREERVETKD